MKVLMLKDVSGVGNKGQIKEVKQGYAINYLLPNKLAVLADNTTVKNFQIIEQAKKDKELLNEKLSKKIISDLQGKQIIIYAKTNEKNHLFKAVHISDIILALEKEYHLKTDSSWFPKNFSIKETGEHKLEINRLGLKSEIIVKVSSEN